MNNIDIDLKIDFFKETKMPMRQALTDPALKKAIDDMTEFMAYMGIERLTLKGKTKEDDKKYRDNLKVKKIYL